MAVSSRRFNKTSVQWTTEDSSAIPTDLRQRFWLKCSEARRSEILWCRSWAACEPMLKYSTQLNLYFMPEFTIV
jgi:hypothetical protein